MKLCPECDFIYEDNQSFCDMDGKELIQRPAPEPPRSRLTIPVPPATNLLVAVPAAWQSQLWSSLLWPRLLSAYTLRALARRARVMRCRGLNRPRRSINRPNLARNPPISRNHKLHRPPTKTQSRKLTGRRHRRWQISRQK